MAKSLLLINGSPNGAKGNCAELIDQISSKFGSGFETTALHLASINSFEETKQLLEKADCFLFLTGTYWDSWGSPLQRFLEAATLTEGSAVWLGKPAAVVVLMHSVGGKGVLSRLQGVLSTFGAAIPPMSGMVYSAANQIALSADTSELQRDLWCLDDLATVCHNLKEACLGSNQWQTWRVDRTEFDRVWLKS